MDETHRMRGLDVEIVTAAAKHAGVQIVFKEYPWKRILYYLENGELDLTTGASKTPERETFADFSVSYRTESVVMYVRKGTSERYPFTELKDIIPTSFQLGVETGYHYGDNFAELLKNPAFARHVQTVNRAEMNYHKLQSGRIDGLLADPIAGAAYLKKNSAAAQFEIHPMQIYSDAIYFMVSKKSPHRDLVRLLNDSINTMNADGTLEAIIAKWR